MQEEFFKKCHLHKAQVHLRKKQANMPGQLAGHSTVCFNGSGKIGFLG